MDDLVVNSWLTIPARELSWSAVRSSGAGGQNVNKVSSKVDLRFDLPGSSTLHPAVKRRLETLAKKRLDGEGKIQIVSQITRDQARNLLDARERLAELIRAALHRPKARRATRKPRSADRKRLAGKRKQAEKKAGRRTPPRD